jgi:hypothetical protein
MESKTSLVEVEDWRTAMAGPGRKGRMVTQVKSIEEYQAQ